MVSKAVRIVLHFASVRVTVQRSSGRTLVRTFMVSFLMWLFVLSWFSWLSFFLYNTIKKKSNDKKEYDQYWIHDCSFVSLNSLQGQGSVSVADVPVAGLVGLDLACPDCLPVLMFCLLLALDLLHDGQHLRGRITRGEKETGSCHCFVFHAVSIAPRTLIARSMYDTCASEPSPTTTWWGME